MKLLSVEFLEGKFLGAVQIEGQKKNFPLINLHFYRTVDREMIQLLADKKHWIEEGGDKLKAPNSRVVISYGIYSHVEKGKETLLYIFGELLEAN